MPDMHKLLDECQSQSQSLVNEIETFKESRVLHQQATEALEATAIALRRTLKEMKPLTEKRIRNLSIIILSATLVNLLLFLIVLYHII